MEMVLGCWAAPCQRICFNEILPEHDYELHFVAPVPEFPPNAGWTGWPEDCLGTGSSTSLVQVIEASVIDISEMTSSFSEGLECFLCFCFFVCLFCVWCV